MKLRRVNMRSMKKMLRFLLFALLLTACQFLTAQPTATEVRPTPLRAVPVASAPPTRPPAGVTLTPTREPSPTPIPVEHGFPQYHLEVVLDYDRKEIVVSQLLQYTNQTGTTLDELVLVIEPLRYININFQDSFELLQLAWEGMDGKLVTGAKIDGVILTVPLRESLQPGEIVNLFMVYIVRPPLQAGIFGYTQRQIVFNHWFPFVPHYDKGWVIPIKGELGEHLVYPTADYYVEIFNHDPDVIVAGPAPAFVEQNVVQYELLGARTFSWSASPEYVELYFQLGEIPVWGYVFPEQVRAGEAVLQATAEALDLFEFLFGPYPFEDLTMVVIDHYDGLEADGLFYIGELYLDQYNGTQRDRAINIAVHETAHQWFYSLVGSNPALEPWLDEAIATYSEQLYFENVYPEHLDWWWDFRVNNYLVYEKVNRSIYEYFSFSSFVRGVYVNGVKFIHALREALGDEAFFAGLTEYLKVGRYQVMSGEDFLNIMTKNNPAVLPLILEIYFDPEN